MRKPRWWWRILVLAGTLAAISACGQAGHQSAEEPRGHATEHEASLAPVVLLEGEKLSVVATTSIVADVVRNVGGDLVEVVTLLPLGADPHAFDPTPQDVTSIADAHVVFANGAGLEVFLDHLLESAGEGVAIVHVSEGIELLAFGGERASETAEADHDHAGADPHVWFDPHSVMIWVDNIAQTLAALDPERAGAFEDNADSYSDDLRALDEWIEEQVALIPSDDRRLVTDHASFSYFARRYGFEQVGAVFPGYSTMAEPSARELAGLEEAIVEQDVRAVFVGLTVNPDLAQRVADDTGTRLVFLYTGSLSDADGPAGDYVSFMRFNVSEIVEALR